MGENRHESFRHENYYKNWAIFNRDEAPETVIYLEYKNNII